MSRREKKEEAARPGRAASMKKGKYAGGNDTYLAGKDLVAQPRKGSVAGADYMVAEARRGADHDTYQDPGAHAAPRRVASRVSQGGTPLLVPPWPITLGQCSTRAPRRPGR